MNINNVKVDNAEQIYTALKENEANSLHLFDGSQIDLPTLISCLDQNQSLEVLYISNMNLNDTQATAIVDAVKNNPKLACICLPYNKITNDGAINIAQSLENAPELVSVLLDNNEIEDSGAEALFLMLKVKAPSVRKRLELDYNLITKGARIFPENTSEGMFLGSRIFQKNRANKFASHVTFESSNVVVRCVNDKDIIANKLNQRAEKNNMPTPK